MARHDVPPIVPFGRVLGETTSTNDEAARLAEAGAPDGTWVVADSQTAGRGRRGRAWASPPGAGLYLSVVCRPSRRPDDTDSDDPAMARLTLLAGVAVVEGVQRASGVAATLKWPNDIVIEHPADGGLVSRRKLAGILAEGSTTAGALQYVIVGIGVNLRRASYDPELAARAISIEEAAGRPVERDAVLEAVLGALAAWRQRVRDGGSVELIEAWRRLAPTSLGHRVSWSRADGRQSGRTAGITEDGALLVRTGGRVERIVAGELNWE